MKLTAIRANNYTSLRGCVIEIPESANALVIAGPNGAGKTTLLDGIRFALTDELPRGLRYKKDLPSIITQGESEGMIGISFMHGDRQLEHRISLKSGSHAGDPVPALGPAAMVLNPRAFLDMDAGKRRRVLFDRAGISLSATAIADSLLAEKHAPARVDVVRKALAGGFDSAAKAAREEASQARGAWQVLTGENYGAKKAAEWAAAEIDGNIEDLENLVKKLEKQLVEVSAKQARAVNKRNELQGFERQHVAAIDDEKTADRLPSLEIDMGLLETRISTSQTRLDTLRAEATGRVGKTYKCPCCDTTLFLPEGGQLEEYRSEVGGNAKVAQAAAEAESGVLANFRREKSQLQRAIDTARAAKMSLERLPERPTNDDLAAATAAAAGAIEDMRTVETELENARAAVQKIAQQQQLTEKARAKHEDVAGYGALAEAIEAMPARFTEKAVGSVNVMLADVSKMMALPAVVSLGDDMVLRYGTIPYGLASRSQQWRAELALGMALGEGTGGILLMDEFDLIQPQDRGAILVALGQQKLVQVILGATLKAAPTAVPPGVYVEWVGG